MRRLARWAAVLAMPGLASCGFHLQQPTRLPATLAVVSLDAVDTQSDFYHALRRSLQDAGTTLSDSDPRAVKLSILKDDAEAKVLIVSALNVPTDYEFTYTVRFAVKAGDKELIAPENLTLMREYSYTEATVLARQREQDVLRAALARDLSTVVMRRLASL
ncbi:MAG TPA: LPS assembly lipoprotein LptE [Steroidobacteraceae bacterium]|nr:LPS assembly lipoprotein LptE [Steroidobacteraceae bacterium]